MNIISKIIVSIVSVIISTSVIAHCNNSDYRIEDKIVCENNIESQINNLYSKIEELQCQIDDIELDINRSLYLKLDDFLGFKRIIEINLQDSSSLSSLIKNNIKLYQNNRDIECIENQIEKNNILVSELNEKIELINQKILQLTGYEGVNKDLRDIIKTIDNDI